MQGRRRGFTLLEITVALVTFAIVAMALTRVFVLGQRATSAQSTRASLQASLRVASLVVPNELRMLNQADSTDIAAISDSSIVYRAMRGYYTVCATITGATSIKVIDVQPSGFTFAFRAPVSGDSAFVFFEDDTLKISDDRWAPVQITGVASSGCTYGGTTYAAYTLTLGGPGGGIDSAKYPLANFRTGAPVRTYELTTLAMYGDGSERWFGMCAGAVGCTLQPMLGPLARPNGVTITRYNDAGAVVTGTDLAARNSLRSLRLRFIGIAEQKVSRGGDPRSLIQDTLTTVVTLRSHRQN